MMRPWPYEWREGMRLLAVPELNQPALQVYTAGLSSMSLSAWTHLYCVEPGHVPPRSWGVDARDPRVQPDLDHDGTLGILKGMVREASGDEFYALDGDEANEDSEGRKWYEPVTCRTFTAEGEAYKAALDHLATRAKYGDAPSEAERELASDLMGAIAAELGEGYDVSARVKDGRSEIVCNVTVQRRGGAGGKVQTTEQPGGGLLPPGIEPDITGDREN